MANTLLKIIGAGVILTAVASGCYNNSIDYKKSAEPNQTKDVETKPEDLINCYTDLIQIMYGDSNPKPFIEIKKIKKK